MNRLNDCGEGCFMLVVLFILLSCALLLVVLISHLVTGWPPLHFR